jgi:hypothetical protein
MGMTINDERELEREADVAGDKAVNSGLAAVYSDQFKGVNSSHVASYANDSKNQYNPRHFNVAQLTLQDVNDGDAYLNAFTSMVTKATPGFAHTSADSRNKYINGTADASTEVASKGYLHATKELATHGGGYLYQEQVHASLSGLIPIYPLKTYDPAHVSQGSTNASQPDIIATTNKHSKQLAIEVKSTSKHDGTMGGKIAEAVEQLSRRSGFQNGMISILLTNPLMINDVLDPAKNLVQRLLLPQLGVYSRSWDARGMNKIKIVVENPTGPLLLQKYERRVNGWVRTR